MLVVHGEETGCSSGCFHCICEITFCSVYCIAEWLSKNSLGNTAYDYAIKGKCNNWRMLGKDRTWGNSIYNCTIATAHTSWKKSSIICHTSWGIFQPADFPTEENVVFFQSEI